ncbi:MAG: DUF1800 family protein [Verrucomicrobiota bacterium]
MTATHTQVRAAILGIAAFSVLTTSAQVDGTINRQVWKLKFGVLDAQMDEQAPYAGWLSGDDDGDGVSNRDEFLAGTSPFAKRPTDAHFRPPQVAMAQSSLSLTFPTVPGKHYGVQASDTLVGAWSSGSVPDILGDGTAKTFVVSKSAGQFFKLSVSDHASQGDWTSDWAKIALGLSTDAPLGAQTGYDHSSLAAALEAQNLITMAAPDPAATQPVDATTTADDVAIIRVNRSGNILLGELTVALTTSGTAVEGLDFALLPDTLTFPDGVNSLDVRVTPLFNPARTSTATVFLTVATPGAAGSSGNFSLGVPSTAGITLNPSGSATGTGLTATYFPGSSSTYTDPLNFSGLVRASYSYTRTSSVSGTATITFSGHPETPYSAGSSTNLQFTSGSLLTSFGTMTEYTVAAVGPANTFSIPISGTNLPGSSSGSVNLAGFSSPVTRLDPTLDFNWKYGSPNGNSYVGSDDYSVVWDGWLAPSANGSYVFRLDADDKARVSIDTGNGLQTILENGWDTPATGGYKESAPLVLAVPGSPAARYPIRVEFVETSGDARCRFQWKSGSGSFASIPSTHVFTNNSDSTPGWNAAYQDNSFTPPLVRNQTDSAVTNGNSGDWGSGIPHATSFHNNFSVRWIGQILPQYSQTYTFVARVDDGVKLWVNQQLVLERWPGGGATDTLGSIELKAGVRYDISLEYYEATGAAEARLSWFSQDQAKQIIPMSRLFPTHSGKPARPGDAPAGQPAITSATEMIFIIGSAPAVTLPVTATNSGVISVSGLPAWLTLSGAAVTGVPTTPGIYQFTVTATNSAGSGSAVFTLDVRENLGQLTREVWTTGVSGPALADVPWTTPPSSSDTVATAEDNTVWPPNTGARLRGYFSAPVSGNYYFWIAASGVAELWISNDAEPVNQVLRARVGSSPERTWDSQPSQKSAWLALRAGQKYYFELRHNTASGGSDPHLSAAWFLDPTGNTPNPLANGSLPASPVIGGIIHGPALSPWDFPPTTSVPGTLYITNLQGAPGLPNITGSGGAFLRVNGSSAVLHLDHSGLTSGAVSQQILNVADEVVFDLKAQDKHHPALRTSDGGYSWNLQPAHLAALENGELRIVIGTLQHPTGELSGTFGKTSGSQTPPATPAYPGWDDLHATSDAANSRFLTQATFGPSPAHMAAVKSSGYRPWIDDQFAIPATHNLPYILSHLSNDPQNAYQSGHFFNSWWKNAVTAPDQLRQRVAFALSQILVVSNTGPLDNNGRVLADYYDTLLDHGLGNFRDILKHVTLSPAMGVYLDMRGNAAGNIQTGLHPNENYAREIMQLFSAGLYRVWPDGTLVLDSTGNAVPTYDQSVITGMARVFTGWTWGQALVGSRLPSEFYPPSNYLDPMVLVPTRHELGSKILLDNVVLPAATVTDPADSSTDPLSTHSVQTTNPLLGAGNLVTTTLTNRYDLNGIRDLEAALDSIVNNSATGPYICRQLIQRLVTSHPKPEYVHRVVRAFNGERNVDDVATGIRGDMKEVIRAILLDSEARSATAAADVQFGKQREPLLRLTAPARSFPAATYPNSSYRQSGFQTVLVTTPVPHRLINGETILLDDLTDGGGNPALAPTSQSYAVSSSTPAYSLDGPSGIVTITAPGYQDGDSVALRFTSGTLGSTAPFNTLATYDVLSATATSFTIDLGVTTLLGTITGNAHTPNNFTVANNSLATSNYTTNGNTVTISSSNYLLGQKVYLKFSSGGLADSTRDQVYTITSSNGSSFEISLGTGTAPESTSGSVLIPRLSGGYRVTTTNNVSSIFFQTTGNHNLSVGDLVQIHILVANLGTPASSIVYSVAAVDGPNSFTVTAPNVISSGSQGSGGMIAYPLSADTWTSSGTTTVSLSTWNVGTRTDGDLQQTPLDSPAVFNFFYPDYRYPGEIARAGMTVPEFQLTNDSTVMNLTNAISRSILSAGNPNGFTSYQSGGGAITMDLGPYMTPTRTANSGIPDLVDELGILLTGGNLSLAGRDIIINYATSLPYTTPTDIQMRDRVRAVVHLILISAEFAIQK